MGYQESSNHRIKDEGTHREGALGPGKLVMQNREGEKPMNKTEIPDWVIYPQEKWVQITPAQAGFDAVKVDSVVGDSQVKGARWEGEVHEEKEWGAVLTRGGYL